MTRLRMTRRGAAALVIVAVVFLYRFNTLGGSLGGFDDDHFIVLTRANQLLAGEWPLLDYPDASLQGTWPPLAYLAPAASQLIVGRSLLAEALLVTGIVAAGAGIAFVAATRLGLPIVLAVAAALAGVVPSIKLYGYARPLLFALTALLAHRYASQPTMHRLLALSLLWSAAFLVRHDYAFYIGAGLVVSVGARQWGQWRVATRHLLVLGAVALLVLLPSLLITERLVGLNEYLEAIRVTAADERSKTQLVVPAFDRQDIDASAIALTYYAAIVLPWAASAVAVWRRYRGADIAETAAVCGLSATAVLANQFLLRGNLGARVADPAVLHGLLAAWLVWLACRRPWSSRPLRIAVGAVAVGAAVIWFAALAQIGSLAREVATARFTEGPVATVRTLIRIAGELAAAPPRDWEAPYPEDGAMLAAAYLSTCTSPRDRVLNARYGAEALVFGRRLPAAGQTNMVPGHYATDADQRRLVERAMRQSIPLVLMEPIEISRAFDRDFPIVHAFLRDRYVEVGTIPTGDDVYARVLAHRNLLPARPFGVTALPCFR